MTLNDYLADMGDRHIGLFTEEERTGLQKAVICGAGAGGVGGGTYLALARLGCRIFRIADCGSFDATNSNRQTGCAYQTVGTNKAEVLTAQILQINPDADVTTYPEGVTEENLQEFLGGGSVVIDGIDLYALEIKKKMYDRARAAGISVISCPIFGFGSALAIFDPLKSPTFDDHFGVMPDKEDTRAYQNYLKKIAMGFFGFRPRLDWPTFMDRVFEGKCPSVGTSCMLSGSLGALAVVDRVLDRNKFPVVPTTMHIDLDQMRLVKVGPIRRFFFKISLIAYLLMLKK